MHLINVKTLKLEEFFGNGVPPYAILSHTWGKDKEEIFFMISIEGVLRRLGIA